MLVLVFCEFYLPGYKGGGPIKTIKNLVDYTNKSIRYSIITGDRDLGDSTPYKNIELNLWTNIGSEEVIYVQTGFDRYKRIIQILFKMNYDIIYLNSFFSIQFSILPLLLAKILRKQIVLAPKGELSQGALSLNSSKKNALLNLYKLLKLHHGIVFQASSKYELQDIQKALGPNTDIKIAGDIGTQNFAKELPYRSLHTIKAIFVSRISPMKNLSVALSILKNVQSPLIYDIYGPIEDESYWEDCLSIIESLPNHINVTYRGELHPNDVLETMTKYDFFYMPTKGENYGHVIAEALCAGLPLLIANTTPWRYLESKGIGWDLPLDNLDSFSNAIDNIASMSLEEHNRMRMKVLSWAKKKFMQQEDIEANIAMFNYAFDKKKGIKHAI